MNEPASIVEELELIALPSERVLGIASLLSSGDVLLDTATHPYGLYAQLHELDLWTHLRCIGNGYVMMRPARTASTARSADAAEDRS